MWLLKRITLTFMMFYMGLNNITHFIFIIIRSKLYTYTYFTHTHTHTYIYMHNIGSN